MPIQSKVVFCTIGLCSSLLATVTDDEFLKIKIYVEFTIDWIQAGKLTHL